MVPHQYLTVGDVDATYTNLSGKVLIFVRVVPRSMGHPGGSFRFVPNVTTFARWIRTNGRNWYQPKERPKNAYANEMIHSTQMNDCLRAIEAHNRYAAGAIAWNDGKRGVDVVNGTPVLSAFGPNITDVCIVDELGNMCQFIRPPNMDETLGVMDAKDVLMVDKDAANISVQDLLDDIEDKCKYMGYTSIKTNTGPNEKVVVRFQTAWVPIKKGTTLTKIVPQHYSYQTRSRTNPRNLLVLGTPQGVFAHNDDSGGNKLFAHSVDASGTVHNHWFEAESNKDCMVGHAAIATEEEGLPKKKARAVETGIRGMGPRTNCFVTVAIPNTQKKEVYTGGWSSLPMPSDDEDDSPAPVYRSLGAPCTGKSYSARVSVAEESVGTCDANAIDVVRPVDEPIVVTILTYNTVEVPDDFEGESTTMNIAPTDVALGVADLDRQYDLVKKNGGVVCKLSELPAMLRKLTKKDMAEIVKKVAEDPPPPKADPMVPTASALAAFA